MIYYILKKNKSKKLSLEENNNTNNNTIKVISLKHLKNNSTKTNNKEKNIDV